VDERQAGGELFSQFFHRRLFLSNQAKPVICDPPIERTHAWGEGWRRMVMNHNRKNLGRCCLV
jgi:hypothetical protein